MNELKKKSNDMEKRTAFWISWHYECHFVLLKLYNGGEFLNEIKEKNSIVNEIYNNKM